MDKIGFDNLESEVKQVLVDTLVANVLILAKQISGKKGIPNNHEIREAAKVIQDHRGLALAALGANILD